jgi:hypothetical protein
VQQTAVAVEGFYYLSKYQVLIYKEHAIGIQNLRTHLLQHHTASRKERAAILTHYSSYSIINRPQNVQLPPPLSAPIPALREPLNRLQYTKKGCAFLTINKDTLRKHYKSKHTLS